MWWYRQLLLILLFHDILRMIGRIYFKRGTISFHKQEATDRILALVQFPFKQIHLHKLCSQYLLTSAKIRYTKICMPLKVAHM